MSRKMQRLLTEPIGQLNLSVRTANTLDEAGVLTINDLLHCCPRHKEECDKRQVDCKAQVHLMDITNFGEKTLQEVFLALEEVGFIRKGCERDAEQRQRDKELEERAERMATRRRRFPRI